MPERLRAIIDSVTADRRRWFGGIALLAVAVAAWLWIRPETVVLPAPPIPLPASVDPAVSFSRVSVFIPAPIKGSLAVPSTWEGKYRMDEAGLTATFYFSADPYRETRLFAIRQYPAKEGQSRASLAPEERILAETEGAVFSYEAYPPETTDFLSDPAYQRMLAEIPLVLDSFKSFSL
jgi:hypothetical protein